jgi:murein L,D-transpeptidase YafK
MAAANAQATAIVVDKTVRKLTLMRSGDVLKACHVALRNTPIGPKQLEGDGRTPEGRHVLDSRNPRSHNHLALHVSYPDATDRARVLRLGAPPGGDIMIYGLRNDLDWAGSVHRAIDRTDGCILLTNSLIEKNLVTGRSRQAD